METFSCGVIKKDVYLPLKYPSFDLRWEKIEY